MKGLTLRRFFKNLILVKSYGIELGLLKDLEISVSLYVLKIKMSILVSNLFRHLLVLEPSGWLSGWLVTSKDIYTQF